MACANALRTFLPELLALSTNSPFWQGRATGLASTRVKVFEPFPRAGIPPLFASYEEFELLVERGIKTNSFEDYTYIWWDLRPHPRLGTSEVRVCDAQTRIESVAAITALVQSLVATFAASCDRGEPLPTEPITLVAENKWRAARYGLDGKLIDFGQEKEIPIKELILEYLDFVDDVLDELESRAEVSYVRKMLEMGCGAERQLDVFAKTGDLKKVVEYMVSETAAGL